MTLTPERIVPRAIALAVIGFCAWPSLAALVTRPESAAPPKQQEQTAAKPAPKPPAATRDPFLDPVAMALAAEQKAAAEAKATGKTPGKPGVAGQTADAPLPQVAVDPLAGLVLEATSVVGNQRLAVINGKLYAPKDMLAADADDGLKRRVVDVQPYKVVLDCDGRRMELKYANAPARREQANKPVADKNDSKAPDDAGNKKPSSKKTSKAKNTKEANASTP